MFTAACPSKTLHALVYGKFLHTLKYLFMIIINKQICDLLDKHVSS